MIVGAVSLSGAYWVSTLSFAISTAEANMHTGLERCMFAQFERTTFGEPIPLKELLARCGSSASDYASRLTAAGRTAEQTEEKFTEVVANAYWFAQISKPYCPEEQDKHSPVS